MAFNPVAFLVAEVLTDFILEDTVLEEDDFFLPEEALAFNGLFVFVEREDFVFVLEAVFEAFLFPGGLRADFFWAIDTPF